MNKWFFSNYRKGDHISQHMNAEYFKTDHIENVVQAFIRETIQNSLDAKEEGKKFVRVRFNLGQKSIKHFDKTLFNELNKHLLANNSGIDPEYKNALKRNFNYVVCEDFNTTGFGGDVNYTSSIEPDEENDFYYFFRNDGRSGKVGRLGRWGIGKTIFPAISKINLFWSLTQRKSDRKKYIMGKCILGYHHIGKNEFMPIGYFGKKAGENIILPVDDKELIKSFEDIFSLKRGSNNGVSIVVPYVGDIFTTDKILFSVINQFLYPILKGELVVEINKTNSVINIDKKTVHSLIESLADKTDGEKYKIIINRSISLNDIISKKSEDHIILNKDNLKNTPQWSGSKLFPPDTLEQCQMDFEQGKDLAFKIPVQIHHKNRSNEWGNFKLYIERDEHLIDSEDIFIREGLRIPGIHSISGRHLRGVFIADEPPLTDFLNAAENPAHTEWQEEAAGFSHKYSERRATLNFIKNCFSKVISIITRPLEGVDTNVLAEFFPFTNRGSSLKLSKRPTKQKGKKTIKPEPPKRKSFPPTIVTKIDNGFKIRRNFEYPEEINTIVVKVAYGVVRGNPLSLYNSLDFSFQNDNFSIVNNGVKVIKMVENKINYEITDSDFSVEITGFDSNRDLYVKVDKVN